MIYVLLIVRCVAHKIHLTERTYYALMHANQGFICNKRGQVDIKVVITSYTVIYSIFIPILRRETPSLSFIIIELFKK